MADEQPETAPPGEPSEENPPSLIHVMQREPPRRLKVVPVNGIVAFPDSFWPINFTSPQFAQSILRDEFAIITHRFPNESDTPEIGTLAVVRQGGVSRANGQFRIAFACLSRVRILNLVELHSPHGIIREAEWQPIPPLMMDETAWQKEDTALNIMWLAGALKKIHMLFTEGHEQTITEGTAAKDEETEQEAKRVKEALDLLGTAITALKTAAPHTVELRVNHALTALERLFLAVMDGKLEKDLLEFLRSSLWTISLVERLAMTTDGVATIYLKLEHFLGHTDEEQKAAPDADSLTTALLSHPRELPHVPPSITRATHEGEWRTLDRSARSGFFRHALSFFERFMVNQRQPIEQVLRTIVAIQSGLLDEEKGAKVAGLFLGPTGVGKTELVKVFALFLFGDPNGFSIIEGSTLMQEHSVARIIGAEPGYIGFDESPLTQWGLDRAHVLWMVRNAYHGKEQELQKILTEVAQLEMQLRNPRQGATRINTEAIKQRLQQLTGWQPGKHLALVLVDEIEKAHRNVQHALLRVLNDGKLQCANGEVIICQNAIFTFTGNIGAEEIAKLVSGRKPIGIHPASAQVEEDYDELNQKLYDLVLREAPKVLLPEFLGRIGKERIRVFRPFSGRDVREIIERIRLPELVQMLMHRGITLFITEAAIQFVFEETRDPLNRSLGARAVRNVIERKIKEEIALLLDVGREDSENGIVAGDAILIDVETKENGQGQQIVIKKQIARSS